LLVHHFQAMTKHGNLVSEERKTPVAMNIHNNSIRSQEDLWIFNDQGS
jgi:hypothetical protein